jgi:hypothetical protein
MHSSTILPDKFSMFSWTGTQWVSLEGGQTQNTSISYIHEQLVPSLEWNIVNSGLNRIPNINIYDLAGNEVIAETEINPFNVNNIKIKSSQPSTGRVILT